MIFVEKYDSVSICSLSNNIDRGSLSRVIRNKKYYISGFYYFDNENIDFDFNSVKFLCQYNGDVLIERFVSVADAIDKTNISKSSIYRLIGNKVSNKYYFLWV